ncbi:hypothetical protein BJY21_001040 [Kineosphaera limosa]|uniref:matrixin family metalloprotease n=1 Tax=Kineosphaera limosa TaxID=111564 RepID=UPI0015C7544B|nr:matrixin family metalloprotease [Kineosphaera limosa]NYD99855.1 hypothetical protein [Kineosphaera limosa]
MSPNAKFTVTGRISNEGAAFKDAAHALLEQRFGGEWVPVGKPVKAAADGTYALPAVSEDLQAQTSYRVVVPRGGATLATSREFTIELAAGRHTAFKLLGGARWQPCAGTQVREIKYGINLASIPPGYAGADEAAKRAAMIADVAGAVEQLALATGLKFTRVEHEQPIPQQPGSGAAALQPFLGGAELVIGFADNSASATSTLLPAKVGRSSGWGSYVDTNGDGFIDQGYVVLDARHRLDGGYKSSRNGTWQQIIMHEVAHASGLSHPDDAKQLMHPQINPALTTWGAGDLNGLQRIGLRPKQDSPKRIAGLRGDACA